MTQQWLTAEDLMLRAMALPQDTAEGVHLVLQALVELLFREQRRTDDDAATVSRLVAALREQWESNHSEHWRRAVPALHNGECYWPRPDVLVEAEARKATSSKGKGPEA